MSDIFKFIITSSGQSQSYRIAVNNAVVIGRSNEEGQLVVNNPHISRKHLSITARERGLYIEDLGSTNGTLFNGNILYPKQPRLLTTKDVVYLTQNKSVSLYLAGAKVEATSSNIHAKENTKDLQALLYRKSKLLIGRSIECDIQLDDLRVSRRHALISKVAGKVVVEDLNSSNGVFVNGRRISGKQELKERDLVIIGLYTFSLTGTLRDLQMENAISAVSIKKVFENGYTGLQTTDLDFPYRQFIALMGPSGCGKSTLLKALNGDSPPTHGMIRIFGLEMQSHFEMIKHIIGYVPQENIVHEELTVKQCLYYSAKIRLPEDSSEDEIETRISEVLKSLRIYTGAIPNTKISRLSGGQKKRVSIAVELLTKPKILFLDEPTSPLDPETIEEFLNCIQELCQEGTTVIMVTHKPEDLNYVDRVVFMGINGYLSYDGPKDDLLKHYNKKNLIQIYSLLSEKEKSLKWYNLWYSGRADTNNEFKKVEIKHSSVNFFYQTYWLTLRYLSIKTGNTKNALLLLLQPVLIAALISLSYPHLIEKITDLGYDDMIEEPKIGVLFLMAIAAIWFGVSNSAKEIVGEIDIAKREFMVNLKLGSYLLSKQIVLLLLSSIQLLIFLAILFLVFSDLNNFSLQYAVLMLVSFCAVQYGLLLSALTSTVEEVMSLLPIALMPQIILSGILQPLESELTIILSYITLGRWGTELLARAQDTHESTPLFSDYLMGLLYPDDASVFDTASIAANIIAMVILFFIMAIVVRILVNRKNSLNY
jgi:ABC-type multidrug transport system ATPase subunit